MKQKPQVKQSIINDFYVLEIMMYCFVNLFFVSTCLDSTNLFSAVKVLYKTCLHDEFKQYVKIMLLKITIQLVTRQNA